MNSPTQFGLVSRLIHWAMAALILGMLLLGTRLGEMQPGLANLWLYGLHKTGGFVALSLVVLRVVWHRISPPPAPLGSRDAGAACAGGAAAGVVARWHDDAHAARLTAQCDRDQGAAGFSALDPDQITGESNADQI
ncbi:MAG: cytochrome b/b6 domain-containing protein [Pseudorhodobacter sp.]|nr:cytochrome b/b6 domain-containing protein [Pseudorhodobacter sp.]